MGKKIEVNRWYVRVIISNCIILYMSYYCISGQPLAKHLNIVEEGLTLPIFFL